MSNTELIQDEGLEASLPPIPVPEVTYRWSQNYARIDTPYKNTYEFSIENEFTVQPLTWEDFYAILALDKDSIVRNFVCALDPKSKEHFRRVSAIEREEVIVPQEVWDRQAEIDLEHARKGRLESFKNEYQRNIAFKIQHGTLDHIPETLEADAEAYALEKMKQEDEDKLNQELEANKVSEGTTEATVIVDETQVLENTSTQNVVDPVTEPLVETVTQPEVTPTVDPVVEPTTVEPTLEPTVEPVVEPTVETPVEITPTEIVAPTEVPTEPTTPESEVVPTEEAPTTEPVVETLEENPTVEPTLEPTAPTVEPTVEAPIEESAPTTSKKKKSS